MIIYAWNGLPLHKWFISHKLPPKLFAIKQEACKKDVERAFNVLESKFAIMKWLQVFEKKKICITWYNDYNHYYA